jgi:uncharacterized protein YecE (DUF72 family)
MESTTQGPSSNSSKLIRLGTTGWSYKDWEGVLYPSGLPHRKVHPLEYLARFFDTAEIVESFSEPLRPELVKLWCRKVAGVNPNFRFTAKLYRAFTHSPGMVMEPTSAATIRPTDEDEIKTREGLDILASERRLGALLIQFPLSFKNTSLNREYIDRLLRQFIEYPRVIEVRDSSWNNADTLAAFAHQNVGFCNIDQPSPQSLLVPAPIPAPAVAYVRVNGYFPDEWFDSDYRNDRANYLYKERELEEWKEKIETVAQTAQTIYVVANNHAEGKAAVNALQLAAMLKGKRVSSPPALLQKYPELRKFADPAEDLESGGSSMPRPA